MHAMQLVLALGAHFPAIYGWFLVPADYTCQERPSLFIEM